MAGDLEGKIGEIAGTLKAFAPTVEALGQKTYNIGEKLAAMQENVKQVWIEIAEIKKAQEGGSKKIWDVVLSLISALIGGGIMWLLSRAGKP